MPRISKLETIKEELLEAARKGLSSASSSERAQSQATLRDMVNPSVTQLAAELKAAKKDLEEKTQELATRPSVETVEQLTVEKDNIQRELEALKESIDAERKTMRAELVAEADRKLQEAEATLSRAEVKEATAEVKYSQNKLKATIEEFQKVTALTPCPPFFEMQSRARVSAFYWASWPEFPLAKAALWVSLFDSISPAIFKPWAINIVHRSICQYDSADDTALLSDEIITKRRNERQWTAEFALSYAKHLGCHEEVRKGAEEITAIHTSEWHDRCLSTFQGSLIRAQQRGDASFRRPSDNDGFEPPQTGYDGPHVSGCGCFKCGGPLASSLNLGGSLTPIGRDIPMPQTQLPTNVVPEATPPEVRNEVNEGEQQ